MLRKRILLVDDNAMVIGVIQLLLERLGHCVAPFTNSLDALQAFRETPEAFDLVITDMRMPKLDGARFSTALIEIRPDIPIILCTGYIGAISEEKALALGIREFLTKPIQVEVLGPTIERACKPGSR